MTGYLARMAARAVGGATADARVLPRVPALFEVSTASTAPEPEPEAMIADAPSLHAEAAPGPAPGGVTVPVAPQVAGRDEPGTPRSEGQHAEVAVGKGKGDGVYRDDHHDAAGEGAGLLQQPASEQHLLRQGGEPEEAHGGGDIGQPLHPGGAGGRDGRGVRGRMDRTVQPDLGRHHR